MRVMATCPAFNCTETPRNLRPNPYIEGVGVLFNSSVFYKVSNQGALGPGSIRRICLPYIHLLLVSSAVAISPAPFTFLQIY